MKATHAYCDNCEAIRKVFFEELHQVTTLGKVPATVKDWLGGDVVCDDCAWIVATLFAEAE